MLELRSLDRGCVPYCVPHGVIRLRVETVGKKCPSECVTIVGLGQVCLARDLENRRGVSACPDRAVDDEACVRVLRQEERQDLFHQNRLMDV